MNRLQKLALRAGIQPSYHDIWGKEHHAPESTIHHLLRALSFPTDPDELEAALTRLETRVLPPVTVLAAGQKRSLSVSGVMEWELWDENGKPVVSGQARRQQVELPPLGMGYYRLVVTTRTERAETTLIAAPGTCWLPEDLARGKRVWGVAAQLYSIPSERNWGMGDYGDLQELARKAAAFGADVIGINPVHAPFTEMPQHCSPYSPSNRLFLSAFYLDITRVPGFETCAEAQAHWHDADFKRRLHEARSAALVDYPAIWALKRPVLEILFRHFRKRGDGAAFKSFRKSQGHLLEQQAVFDALLTHFIRREGKPLSWRDWPEAYRDPHSDAVAQFARDHADDVTFHAWLQWLADSQLGNAQEAARQAGMSIGLYRDLAVGSDAAGAEVWLDPERFIHGVSVGAPPDEYNPKGQNWGLPPFNPRTLQDRGFKPFIELLRANMRHARALRIDHAFGLARLFLIPEGAGAEDGAYLTFPFAEMLAVVKVESHRNQCVVIGEDLGTFPPGYKEGAAEAGVLSYRVLYFEKEQEGYKPPSRYPAQALAVVSTHDLPTLSGWWQAKDLEERAALDLYPSETLREEDREGRKADRPRLLQALAQAGIEADEQDMQGIVRGAHRYLGLSPAAIVMVQAEDVLGMAEQMNLPGTVTERPNWRMRLSAPLERLLDPEGPFADMAKAMNESRRQPVMHPPRATYRLQLHKDFTLFDAARIIPYLAALGVSHVYASSYLTARPGSTHGYDITDHNRINPELGGDDGYRAFIGALKTHGMRHILDFVPNHMGVGGADNAWWLSLLEWGKASPYADFFDVDWKPRYAGAESKLVVPFLGSAYGDVLDSGELEIRFDPAEGSFSAWYFTHRFPICPMDYPRFHEGIPQVLTVEEGEALKHRLRDDYGYHPFLHEGAAAVSRDPAVLHDLLERQHYRLAHWRVAASEINYRRFFEINDLAGLRVEQPSTFDAMHAKALELLACGELSGLRIDHIDGLADPAGYCKTLRDKAGEGFYLVVEKILAAHEPLRENWPIQGTSGYDALNHLAGLFVDGKNQKAMERLYQRFTGVDESFEEMVYAAKTHLLATSFASELLVLTLELRRIVAAQPYTRDYTMDGLRQALIEIIGWFPVYRTYVTAAGASEADIRTIAWAVGKAKKRSRQPDTGIYDFIASLLTLERGEGDEAAATFLRRFQQLSGPVMAKGVEDTVFYRYFCLLSLNEVGGEPARFGLSVKAFHTVQQDRSKHWPHAMIATATHDTKRGEDARARISVLSEIPREWGQSVTRWAKFNRSYRRALEDGVIAPSPNHEYLIYQTLIGTWPVELLERREAKALKHYIKRLEAYLTKALREGKEQSSWTQPDETYEQAVHAFVRDILDTSRPNLFLDDFLALLQPIAQAGAVNSLTQTALKLTIPGVPDIYQGTERWDLSLVDPDNRRPVDYAFHQQLLAENSDATLAELLRRWPDGRVKQQLTRRLLRLRAEHPALFAYGSYEPLRVDGTYAEKIIAFARRHEGHTFVIVAPILCATLADDQGWPRGKIWKDTAITLPEGLTFIADGQKTFTGIIPVAILLRDFPVCWLTSASLNATPTQPKALHEPA